MSATAVGDAWATVLASPLGRTGGWMILRLVAPDWLDALRAEAAQQEQWAAPSALDASPDDDRVRGNPARRLDMAEGGEVLRSLFWSTDLAAVLADLTGLRWKPSGGQGAYSYYRAEGHGLDVHRDVDDCDLAIITCLADDGPASGDEGSLALYPGRDDEPVPGVRANPADGAVVRRLEVGESCVLLGGWVAHAVRPIGPGRRRVVAPLCFQAAQ